MKSGMFGVAASALTLLLLVALPVRAGDLALAMETVILTVSGEIENTNNGTVADFDYGLLEALPAFTLNTTTPWTDGEQVFDGVLLRDLMAHLGATDGTLRSRALNDYVIEIPAADYAEDDVIVAYRHNGQRMSVREKGPLWVIYPDGTGNPEAERRMIWQLRSIEVLP